MNKKALLYPALRTPRTPQKKPTSSLWFAAAFAVLTLGLARPATVAVAGSPLSDPPMAASQLSMTVQQNGVPQLSTRVKEADASGITKIRAVSINLRRVGRCDGHVTLKTVFIGTDVATKKKVVNSEAVTEAEAVPGKGNEYSATSSAFTYFPASVDPKTKKPIPAHGTKPVGWVVRVYQGPKLLTATASTPELIAWLNEQGS